MSGHRDEQPAVTVDDVIAATEQVEQGLAVIRRWAQLIARSEEGSSDES